MDVIFDLFANTLKQDEPEECIGDYKEVEFSEWMRQAISSFHFRPETAEALTGKGALTVAYAFYSSNDTLAFADDHKLTILISNFSECSHYSSST